MIDLRTADFSKPVALDGAWHFWWGQLLNPDTRFEAGEPLRQGVPGDWNGRETEAGEATGEGFGTYTLTVLLPEKHPTLGLTLGRVSTAHRLWINGEPISTAGVVGTHRGNSIPRMERQLISIPANTGRVALVVQASNFDHRSGGLRKSWTLGTWKMQSTLLHQAVLIHGMSVVFLLVNGLMFLAMYAVHRRERTRLWFALACLVVAVRNGVGSDAYTVLLLLPGLSTPRMLSIEYASTFAALALALILIRSMYPRESPVLLTRSLLFICTVSALVCLLGDSVLATEMKPILLGMTVASLAGCLLIILRARVANRPLATPLIVVILALIATTAHDTLLSMNLIKGSYELIPVGFGIAVVVESWLLIKQYADSFRSIDELSQNLQVAHDQLSATHTAVIRFVPFEFLNLLGKKSIRDVSRGDHVLLDVSVMFCDIKGFTTLIEGFTPAEAFGFINGWLSRMEPVIYDHGGFIKEYLGDCIVAVYPTSTDDAVRSCIAMQRALMDFELEQGGSEPLQVCFGLHTGPLVMGTIGGGSRLDTGTVGDVVNTASRLESMTRLYGVSFLVSDAVRDSLERPGHFTFRELDQVRAKGKRKAIRIYEVLDGLPQPVQDRRLGSRAAFYAGLQAWRAGQPAEAMEQFQHCITADPTDTAATLYQSRCADMMAAGVPEGWDGITDLQRK